MALAQELVDLIVDNIHDDIPSLKSCSMAAHTFVHSCRTHLFKKIRFNPPDNPFSLPSCQKFYRLLSSSPHIAPLVEDLCIVTVLADRPSDLLTHFNGECMRERNISWITADTTLALVLPLLNLKRISLLENATADCRIYSMNWSKMERPLKSALTSVFSSPRLEAVHIRGIVIESPVQLLSLFSEATGLKEMSLSRLCFRQKDRSESWPESQLWRPQLQSLLVSASGSPLSCRFLELD
ncbi:hypothetical protein K438DRAFT_5912 [Mycena galopus ATCC 62051]|nr:hypothetical protein K438DRAFT_5912 [Mycena galopus ATCC 62051]